MHDSEPTKTHKRLVDQFKRDNTLKEKNVEGLKQQI